MSVDVDPTRTVPASVGPRPPAWRDEHGIRIEGRVVLLVVVLAVTWLAADELGPRWISAATTVALWAIIASGLNLTVGLAGQLNLANAAFFALGAYTAAISASRWQWPGGLTLVVVVVLAAVVALGLSLFVFRAKGLQFALITTGVGLVAYSVLLVWDVTGGSAGLSTAGPLRDGGLAAPLRLAWVTLSTPRHYFLATTWLLAGLVLVLSVLWRSRLASTWQAVRDDEMLAASVGVDVLAAKRSAFILGSIVPAVAGVLFTYWTGYITPTSFGFAEASLGPLAMIVIGGPGTLVGPLVGAVVVAGTPEIARGLAEYSVILYGAVLLATVLFAPGGLAGLIGRRARRRVADGAGAGR